MTNSSSHSVVGDEAAEARKIDEVAAAVNLK